MLTLVAAEDCRDQPVILALTFALGGYEAVSSVSFCCSFPGLSVKSWLSCELLVQALSGPRCIRSKHEISVLIGCLSISC